MPTQLTPPSPVGVEGWVEGWLHVLVFKLFLETKAALKHA
jgi:hypothetical protein